MTIRTPDIDIAAMSGGQRIELIAELWNSLRDEAERSPLTSEQSAEVRRRMALLNAGELELSPWSEAWQCLMDRPSHCS